GLPPRELGATYTNTDFTIADETDLVDVWHLFAYAKEKYPNAFDQGKLIDTRERRRILGEFVMTLVDQINGRTYPDTVVVAYSNFDTHGYTVDPYLELEHPEKVGVRVNVPYRCMLPKGLDGILVGGLGMSAHRDALPLTRMQADLQNQGYALGVAAAMAVRDGVNPRDINVRDLQKHLVEIGNLPERVLTDKDSYPMPIARLREAVRTVKEDFKGAAVLFAQPNDALPLLRKAYADAEGDEKLAYAHVLAVMGDPTGVDTLIAAVEQYPEWDEGWDYRAMGQFGRALSRLDRLIIALGRAGDRKALPAILKKLNLLTAKHAFSHHRAVGLALELLGDPAAARPLADVLANLAVERGQ
ncbi:MAG TPA: FAD-dependent oxidoreductase, partial [Planctomycetaceae bacterium]|nr:FAD-dependent oxidoreductase [Planctomycetaceae bacterium]